MMKRVIGNVLKIVLPTAASSLFTLINRAVIALPVELHLLGYRVFGPGTRFKEKLTCDDLSINELDEVCREHDTVYVKDKDNDHRREADRVLAVKHGKQLKLEIPASVKERTQLQYWLQ